MHDSGRGQVLVICHVICFQMQGNEHKDRVLTTVWSYLSCVTYSVVSLHLQFLHLITDKRPEMFVFCLNFVHQFHIVSLSFRIVYIKTLTFHGLA